MGWLWKRKQKPEQRNMGDTFPEAEASSKPVEQPAAVQREAAYVPSAADAPAPAPLKKADRCDELLRAADEASVVALALADAYRESEAKNAALKSKLDAVTEEANAPRERADHGDCGCDKLEACIAESIDKLRHAAEAGRKALAGQ